MTHLRCGGMILCTAINHCLADGIGTVHFLRDWAQLTAGPASHLPLAPISGRNLLRPRTPRQDSCPRIEFSGSGSIPGPLVDPFMKPMVPTSTLFSFSRILALKELCVPSLKCTSFEVLASHVWRTWVRSLDLPVHLRVKLLFSVNIRSRVQPNLPDGYYGNAFVLACAEASVQELAGQNLCHGVRLVQEAKGRVTNEYVWSVVDHLEKSRAWPDLTASLVISSWTKLGLEDLDFGQGRPVHMGPMSSEIYCLFLPVVNEPDATTVLMSVPADVVDKFEYLLNNYSIERNLELGDNGEMLIDRQKSCLVCEREISRERNGEEILEGRLC